MLSGGIVSTYAGTGSTEFVDDQGALVATFSLPNGEA